MILNSLLDAWKCRKGDGEVDEGVCRSGKACRYGQNRVTEIVLVSKSAGRLLDGVWTVETSPR